MIQAAARYNSKTIKANKRIALVAHDHKKDDLISWVNHNREALSRHSLYATGTTGRLVQEALGVEVTRFLSGPLGGDQQLGALIATGVIDLIFFFWDPLSAQPHDSDVKALLRLAVAWNIPMACDRATADFVITSPLMNMDYEAQVPDYSQYLNRDINPAGEVGG